MTKSIRLTIASFFVTVALLFHTPSAEALDAQEFLSYFVSELSPYGNWRYEQPYGRVWEPWQQQDWQPYSDGHWMNTPQYGWVWIPEEEWGEIPYHYGRWANTNGRWFWVPDDNWGPAWVDWRQDDEYIGWAPLPPDNLWNYSADHWNYIDDWRPRASWRGRTSNSYVFVAQRYFNEPNVRRHILPRAQSSRVFDRTKNVTVYRVVNNRIVNAGPRRDEMERRTGKRIKQVDYAPHSIRGKALPAPPTVRTAHRPQHDGETRRPNTDSKARFEEPRHKEQPLKGRKAAHSDARPPNAEQAKRSGKTHQNATEVSPNHLAKQGKDAAKQNGSLRKENNVAADKPRESSAQAPFAHSKTKDKEMAQQKHAKSKNSEKPKQQHNKDKKEERKP